MPDNPILYYTFALSPPSRAVLLTAKALNINLELRNIDLMKGEQLTSEFRKLNPIHTIPLLVDNDVIVYDSHAICGYLCDKYGSDNSLYPKDIVQRAHVNARLHFDTGFLFARLRIFFEPIFYWGSYDVPIEKLDYIGKCWPLLEAFLENNDYLCGDKVTIADYCCIATVTSCDGLAPIDSQKYPKLVEWIRRMESNEYYKAAKMAEGAIAFKEFLSNKILENKALAEGV
ncbi:Glutathione S-transferase 1 [Pseudolycoriella hygida]|uniref:glutathione transferase n=1 Tax=Pseudolycoriella hygida TaxID=35572 RepID=A0A9Q0MQU5_9DIPT|nr:Glutathione S-transferase 1 [Pseudolycoriella hygida]